MRRILCVIFATGCAGESADVAHQHGAIAVVDTYEKEFAFDMPVPCKLFLHRRITDEDGRYVEYDARINDTEVSAVYSIDAKSQRPLIVELYSGPAGAAALSLRVEAADHDLQVVANASPLLIVSGYDGTRSATYVAVDGPIDDPAGLALLACALPLRTELGPIPQFLLNRASGGRDTQDPDVSHASSNAQPILDWKGEVSILGAYLLEGACIRRDTWMCPCLKSYANTIAGSVPGWCDSAGGSTGFAR